MSFSLLAAKLEIDGIEFLYRIPNNMTENSQIMVLFGGRDWPATKTMAVYKFDDFADKNSLVLISPYFKHDNYWHPEERSGTALKKAIAKVENKHKLKSQKLYFYGYSAGGQCTNLFYAYMPERVAAWGLHGCGVYAESLPDSLVPALMTCGIDDRPRVEISQRFLYNYREQGGSLVWKTFDGGHEIQPGALAFARAWFQSIINGDKELIIGEDDTMRLFPIEKKHIVDPEFRNFLYNATLAKMWVEMK